MNCPSRPDDIEGHPDWNQNPSSLSRDLTTRADLNGIVNLRAQRRRQSDLAVEQTDPAWSTQIDMAKDGFPSKLEKTSVEVDAQPSSDKAPSRHRLPPRSRLSSLTSKVSRSLIRYAKFVGPGFLIAVAYIDPGNYATDVGAGAATQYAHLFVILMSNLFAIFLQSLCIKLGSVTGLDLAQNCRKHLPKWLTWILYALSESAIIATDVAEVIGTAIALNLLLKIPLVAGCAISLADVIILMIFYNPDGSMTRLRVFEFFVMFLVLGVLVCFCVQLSYLRDTSVGQVFRGYVPSPAVVKGNGIYLSCGILGATVMPHSIFLGSGVVQPRLRQLDIEFEREETEANPPRPTNDDENDDDTTHSTNASQSSLPPNANADNFTYQPSIRAIRTSLKYSIIELATSLFTFALFINSAILIVAGSSLYGSTDATSADLFGIYDLLSSTLGRVAGVLFALALLLSGTSAGIVCTMAGQMVSEGMLNWTLRPWLRRLLTRAISIVPSIVIAASIGRDGLNQALNASQVVLSVILPFVTAPLVWFTCRSAVMTVHTQRAAGGEEGTEKVNMRNGWLVTVFAVCIWLVLVIMNVALLVLVGLGKA